MSDKIKHHSRLLTHATRKASQLRTTYTHSPPDPDLVGKENIYLFQSTDFFLDFKKKTFIISARQTRFLGNCSDAGIRNTSTKGFQ